MARSGRVASKARLDQPPRTGRLAATDGNHLFLRRYAEFVRLRAAETSDIVSRQMWLRQSPFAIAVSSSLGNRSLPRTKNGRPGQGGHST
jgi:hypothetical protein